LISRVQKPIITLYVIIGFYITIISWRNNMRNFKFILGAALLLGLIGCADMKGRDIGTVAGAVGGAALGSQIGGTGLVNALGAAGGAVLGGMGGRAVGKKMEKDN
jgi:hypothetical protein